MEAQERGESKIRLVITSNGLSLNGISVVINNYATRLPKSIFDVHVITSGYVDQAYERSFAEHGITLHVIPRKEEGVLAYLRNMTGLFRTVQCDIAHVNGSSALMVMDLLAARAAGVRVRIAHCHSIRSSHPKLHAILKPVVNRIATNKLACSDIAGESLFGPGTFDVLPNAFSVSSFSYDSANRAKLRQDLKIPTDAVVIGNVGRISTMKNQSFAIEVFEEYQKEHHNSYLVVVGDGPAMSEIQERVRNSRVGNRIYLVGNQESTLPFYSAFDVLLFPTKWEGLGIVVLEAQLAGAPCVVSTAVPIEANIGGCVRRISLDESVETWVKAIFEAISPKNRHEVDWEIARRYDIDGSVQMLTNYYLALASSPVKSLKLIRLVVA